MHKHWNFLNKNASLNSFRGNHLTLAGDAFEIMNKLIAQKVFDIVVIDPPSFAKSKSEIKFSQEKI